MLKAVEAEAGDAGGWDAGDLRMLKAVETEAGDAGSSGMLEAQGCWNWGCWRLRSSTGTASQMGGLGVSMTFYGKGSEDTGVSPGVDF